MGRCVKMGACRYYNQGIEERSRDDTGQQAPGEFPQLEFANRLMAVSTRGGLGTYLLSKGLLYCARVGGVTFAGVGGLIP